MLRSSTGVIAACILVCSVTPDASAQDKSAPALPAVEMPAGYALMRDTTTEQDFPAGWYFSPAANLSHGFGLAGKLTGAYKTLSALAPIEFAFQPGGGVTFVPTNNVCLRAAVDYRWGAR